MECLCPLSVVIMVSGGEIVSYSNVCHKMMKVAYISYSDVFDDKSCVHKTRTSVSCDTNVMQNLRCQFLLLCHNCCVIKYLHCDRLVLTLVHCTGTSRVEKHSNSNVQFQPQMHAQ